MSTPSDKEKILAAFGGKKGLFDSGIPALVFLLAFNVTKEVSQSALIALSISAIVTVLRESLKVHC